MNAPMTLKEKILTLAGCAVYIAFLIAGYIHVTGIEKSEKAAVKIHATKLSFTDVMNRDLPQDPGIQKDATISGVDVNKNNIRDDVELEIFKRYPGSAKVRAALLQYALILQMETMYPANRQTATAIAEEDSEAYDCIGRVVPSGDGDIEKINEYRSFIESQQLDTPERKRLRAQYDQKTGSFELKSGCDIGLGLLPN
jgi:hypothetical protein